MFWWLGQFRKDFKICKKRNIILIEDNCEALGAKYNNKYLGTLEILALFLFLFSSNDLW